MFRLKSLQIELTNRCNERCVHCYIPHEDKTMDMDTALLYRIFDQCREMRVDQITFSGGEPMLHSHFLDALDRASWNSIKIRIFTNLTLLDDHIAAQLKFLNIHEVQASLYSVDPDIHDSITQKPGSCEATMRGIETLLENGIPAFISCPLMKQNKDSYPAVLGYAKSHHINSAPATMIIAQTSGGENLANRLSIDEALAVIQSILENDTAYDDERFMPGYTNQEEALPCVQNICKHALCVNAAGDILPSPGWNRILGNLNTRILQDIWENSPEIKSLRNISLNNFPKCAHCPDIQFCGMSLEGNVNENPAGDPFIIPGYVCELARRTRELVHSWYKSKGAI
jgi:radical SAM protein with 4Fe4S-binding SPASM domain